MYIKRKITLNKMKIKKKSYLIERKIEQLSHNFKRQQQTVYQVRQKYNVYQNDYAYKRDAGKDNIVFVFHGKIRRHK